jgi:uncharacterized protein DUF6584
VQSTADILARVKREIDAGRPWRAKEILRGNIGSGRITPEILEELGRLLDSLGDRVEAGKYLFLSGVRDAASAEAIALFRQRHHGRHGRDLLARLPAGVRRHSFHSLPPVVRTELSELGISPESFQAPSFRFRDDSIANRLAAMWIPAVVVLMLLAMSLGVRQMVVWVWRWFQ